MQLSVIIVNFNVKYFLEQCLHAVQQATRSIKAEVIVIDNQSADGSIEYLEPAFPWVRFMKSGSNLGFGKANNLALANATGEYVLFLNPDTLVPEDCFEKCIAFMQARPAAGALGVRMLDGKGVFLPESKRSFPTTLTAFYKLTGIAGLFPRSRHFNKYSLGYLNEHTDHAVDVLAGAFMLVRSRALQTAGNFDERFFMYGEDIDLSYRIKQAGYENWYFAGSAIIHFKGESTKKETRKYTGMFYQAMMVFVDKHYKGRMAGFKWMLRSGIAIRRSLSLLYSVRRATGKKVSGTRRIIAGTIAEYAECCAILGRQDKTKELYRHIDTAAGMGDDVLVQQIQARPASEIIFCMGALLYSQIIRVIERTGRQFAYRFHARGSNSIVGSDSREVIGEVRSFH